MQGTVDFDPKFGLQYPLLHLLLWPCRTVITSLPTEGLRLRLLLRRLLLPVLLTPPECFYTLPGWLLLTDAAMSLRAAAAASSARLPLHWLAAWWCAWPAPHARVHHLLLLLCWLEDLRSTAAQQQ
jgi:hypothetical protein